jgi:DUF1707 SHOCT-like domain
MPVTTGPEDPTAAGGDRLRARRADREQVIGTLQAAFGQGRLTRDELDARAGQALAARTYAELDALIADIPADAAAAPLPRRPVRARDWRTRPLVKAGWLADREYVIDTLKSAFVHGRLTRDELDARAGQALAARTYADLAALIADIPADPAAARPERPPAPARRWPLARAAAKAAICLIIAAAATWVAIISDPGTGDHNPPHPETGPMLLLAIFAVFAALGILGRGVVTSWKLRRSRGQLPPGPRPGGHALDGERRGGTGHGPVPPGLRTDQDRADLRAHKSREHRQRISARAGRAPRGVRPSPGAA